jgi:uncharacterized damage-inducible protein DinB
MTVAQLRSDLKDSRDMLFERIRGLSEEQFRFNPPASAWSIAAHLGHLLRVERLFAERADRALRENEPWMASTRIDNDDDPGIAQHLAVPQIIHGMQASRRDLERVFDASDDLTLERAIVHERIGKMTIRQIMAKMAEHEQEHADEVALLARQAQSASHVIIPLKPRS